MSMDTRGTRYSRNMLGNPATPDRPVDASRPQDGGAPSTTRVHVHDLIVQQGGGRGAAAAATNRGNYIINVDTRGTRKSRNMQGSATPDRTVGASRPQDGGAPLTTRVDVNDLILQQVVERGAAATNRMTPIDKKKKDVKKQGEFYLFIFYEKC